MNTNDINNDNINEEDDFTNGLIIMKNLAWYDIEEEQDEQSETKKDLTSSEMMKQLPVPEHFYYQVEPNGNYQQYLKDNGYIK